MRILLIIIITFFIIALGQNVQAHPLDITGTEVVMNLETGGLEVSTFIHPFLINLLLEKNNLLSSGTEIIYEHPKILTEYYQDNFSIKNNNKECIYKSFNLPPKDEFEIFGGGIEIEVVLQCDELGKIDYKNKMFIEYSPLQTNQMFFYNEEDITKSIHERILTSKIFINNFDVNNLNVNKKEKDTDGDGLSDVEETIYGTNKNVKDTDKDGYSDKEEIDNGWDALNFEMSMGQKTRVATLPINENNKKEETVKETKSFDKSLVDDSQDIDNENTQIIQGEYKEGKSRADDVINQKSSSTVELISNEVLVTTELSDNSSGSKYFKTGKLEKYLKKIKDLFEKGDTTSIFFIFIFIYFLGALHAFESGHGKSILISYMMEKERKLKDGLKFSAYLSVTHLIDVVILVVLFKVFSVVSEAQKYIGMIQKAGAYILLAIAIFYLIQSLKPKRFCKRYKSGSMLGIIAGLAPCTIGWALMITIISIDKVNWLIPVIAIFGLGIFSTLSLFSFLILKFKNKIIGDSEKLSKYASIVSSLMLLAIALILVFRY
ncbi:hypothetical protein KAI92_01440 [Candidatus Parcubacteria bacterium]|nr:hypothetical protein [Candidatus Parcubacteria bacterium]